MQNLPELRMVTDDGGPPPNGHDVIKKAIDETQPIGMTAIELWLTHFVNDKTQMECRWIGLLTANPAGLVQALRAQADTIEKQFGLSKIAIARDLPPNGRA